MEERIVLSLVAVSPSDTKINSTSSLDQTLPSVAMDANGDYVVAWSNQVHLGPNYLYDVEARVYNSAGASPDGRDRRRPDDRRHPSLGGDGRQWRLRRRLAGLEYHHLPVRDLRPAVQPRRVASREYSGSQQRE